MNDDSLPAQPASTTTIARGNEVYVFGPGERIPDWLEREANAALREGRATVSFGDQEQ